MTIERKFYGGLYQVGAYVASHNLVKFIVEFVYGIVSRAIIAANGSPFVRTTIEVDGSFEMYIDLREPVASLSKKVGNYEQPVQQFYQERVDTGMTIADVGTNKGYFLFLGANHVGPDGAVHGFEPESRNYHAVSKMIRRNGAENVVVTQAAISDKCGQTRLFFGDGPGRNTLYGDGEDGETVEQTTLDDAFEPGDLDFIKIDIEGAEWPALQGGRKLLSGSDTLQVLCEVHPDNLQKQDVGPVDVVDFLQKCGMDVTPLNSSTAPDSLSEADLSSQMDEFHLVAKKC